MSHEAKFASKLGVNVNPAVLAQAMEIVAKIEQGGRVEHNVKAKDYSGRNTATTCHTVLYTKKVPHGVGFTKQEGKEPVFVGDDYDIEEAWQETTTHVTDALGALNAAAIGQEVGAADVQTEVADNGAFVVKIAF